MFKRVIILFILIIFISFEFAVRAEYPSFDKNKLLREERNLFASLVMASHESGLSETCEDQKKCYLSLSQIRCRFSLYEGDLFIEGGSCTYKNRDGDLGVLEGRSAFLLFKELFKYGASLHNNGRELKMALKLAACLLTPIGENRRGALVYRRQCQLRE